MAFNKQIHVAPSPLTNLIRAGTVLKDGRTWGAGACDVTGEACGAVCEHVLAKGGPVIVTKNGKPEFRITVERIGGEKC